MSELVGVPFLWNGRDPAVGLDCAGVMLYCARRRRLPLTEPVALYQQRWEAGERDVQALWRMPDGWAEIASTTHAKRNDIAWGMGHVWFLLDDDLTISARRKPDGEGDVVVAPYHRVRGMVDRLWRYSGGPSS